MRLKAEARRAQILDKAVGLFAQYGYEGTTTRRIANEAGVTEAVIFRHFESKEELYWQVISERCMGSDNLDRVREVLASGLSDMEKFTAIAHDRLARHDRNPAKIRLLLFTALENHRLTERFFNTFAAQHYELLSGYITQRVREGKFRPVDATLAARGFLGMLVYHVMVRELFDTSPQQPHDTAQVAQQIAALWLAGISAESWQNLPAKPSANHLAGGLHALADTNASGTVAAKTARAGKDHVQA